MRPEKKPGPRRLDDASPENAVNSLEHIPAGRGGQCRTFTPLWDDILGRADLSLMEAVVFCVISRFQERNGGPFRTSVSEIAKAAKTTTRTALRAIGELKRLKLVRIHRTFGATNFYQVGPDPAQTNDKLALVSPSSHCRKVTGDRETPVTGKHRTSDTVSLDRCHFDTHTETETYTPLPSPPEENSVPEELQRAVSEFHSGRPYKFLAWKTRDRAESTLEATSMKHVAEALAWAKREGKTFWSAMSRAKWLAGREGTADLKAADARGGNGDPTDFQRRI